MGHLKGFFVKSDEISGDHGIFPESRSAETHIKNGVVIIDKTAGPTSHQISAWVRDMLSLSKTGHSGTLDPNVTGVLVIALQNATKIMPALAQSTKEYVCVMTLHKDVPESDVREALISFTGIIEQLPPVRSAIKRAVRKRDIHEIDVLEIDGRNVLFRVKCQAGTYIRKLCSDAGIKLKCGAHMAELRRTQSGSFSEKDCVKLHDLRDAYELLKEGNEKEIRRVVLPVEMACEGIKKIVVKDTAVNALCNGAPLGAGGIVAIQEGIEEKGLIGIMTLKGELVGLARAAKGFDSLKEMEKGIAATMERIVLARETYPKTW
ncbi:MAG: RNA-guided pseudouridylation complex pseudouridine synthase subunit Cbf5 [Candidatus Aenigmarchaeota archaeon]|nr:RNA-guided pseudouridylation complex pseudouridine synthase subunit Cbf5 [Candidatus Aenigmarchaeota archaeon]